MNYHNVFHNHVLWAYHVFRVYRVVVLSSFVAEALVALQCVAVIVRYINYVDIHYMSFSYIYIYINDRI